MAAMYHIANGERPPLGKEVENKVSGECKDFIYNCCCCPDPEERKTVKELLEHPWLAEASEAGKALLGAKRRYLLS